MSSHCFYKDDDRNSDTSQSKIPTLSPGKDSSMFFVPKKRQISKQDGNYIRFWGSKDSKLEKRTISNSQSFINPLEYAKVHKPPVLQEMRPACSEHDLNVKRSTSTRRGGRKRSQKSINPILQMETHKRCTSSERPCCQSKSQADKENNIYKSNMTFNNESNNAGCNSQCCEKKQRKRKKSKNSRSRRISRDIIPSTESLGTAYTLERIPSGTLACNETEVLYENRLRALERINDRLTEKVLNLERDQNQQHNQKNIVGNSQQLLEGYMRGGLYSTTAASEEVLRLSQELRKRDSEIDSLLALNKSLNDRITSQEEAAKDEITRLRHIVSNLENLSMEQDRKLKLSVEEYAVNLRSERERIEIDQQERIEELQKKVRSLQREVRVSAELEGKVEALKKELIRKENEIMELKTSFNKKLEKRKHSEIKQKKEWGIIYNDLLGEIRTLKGDLDSLSIENRFMGNYSLNAEVSQRKILAGGGNSAGQSIGKDLSEEFSAESSKYKAMREYYY
jgi:hypothetical protein